MLSFTLSESFVDTYRGRPVDWGFTDAGGNSLGEITFLRTYSRLKADGSKERWREVCQRVIEGMFSIQKDYAKANRLPWSDRKAQATAQDAYDRLFTFKWTPPGRGLWVMGTPLVNGQRNSAALQNCAFVSTANLSRRDPAEPFCFLMEASMLGIGVGFDIRGADLDLDVHHPSGGVHRIVIDDSREGWVESTRLLINSYLIAGQHPVDFDYSEIREAGQPIKGFGGTAAGPEPLMRLHRTLRTLFAAATTLDAELIADIGNLIGVCVVSGNVRRSAELMLGRRADKGFLRFKDFSRYEQRKCICIGHDHLSDPFFPNNCNAGCACRQAPGGEGDFEWVQVSQGTADHRAEWGWMSNNSIAAEVGEDLSDLHEGIALNGEPGVVWMDVSRAYGRLIDPPNHKDHRAMGYNPCAEQTLESYECCTLVETYIGRHETLEDYKRTLKVAYLYAKTVTLLPTHWERTNAIMQRNRRIGTSMSGIADFADRRGLPELRRWMDEGYGEIQRLDRVYSEWLCVRESIKTTTVKPGGTTPLLAGESPGVHWGPGGEYFDRAIRFSPDDPMLLHFKWAGYRTVLAEKENAEIVFFPVRSKSLRSEREVSLYEKANLAVLAQRYWSDNSVSVTLSFDPETEADDVARILQMHEGQLKTVSFLPMLKAGAYENMPYTPSTREAHVEASMQLLKVDLSGIYDGAGALEAAGEQYCTTDACEVKTAALNA